MGVLKNNTDIDATNGFENDLQPADTADEQISYDKGFSAGKITLVVSACLVFIILFVGLFYNLVYYNDNYENAVEQYIDQMYNGNYSAYSASLPEGYWSSMRDSKLDEKSFDNKFSDFKNELISTYGESYSVSYEILDKKEFEGYRFGTMSETIAFDLDMSNENKDGITDVYSLKVAVSVSGSLNATRDEYTCIVFRYDNDWYTWDFYAS